MFSDCEALYYCSKNYQKRYLPGNKVLCTATSEWTRTLSKNIETFGNYNVCYRPKDRNKILHLMGRKSNLKICILRGTWANVSVTGKCYINKYFPEIPIRKIGEILNEPDTFQLNYGNQNWLHYDGWIHLDISLTKMQ